MPNKQKKADGVWEKILDIVSETIREGVKRLPTRYGDLLNFLADLIAVGVLLFLYQKDMIPQSQILLSVGMLMVFLLTCFFGTWVMRRFRGRTA
jgi:hypothetical protein